MAWRDVGKVVGVFRDYLALGEEDVRVIHELGRVVLSRAEDVIEGAAKSLLGCEEAVKIADKAKLSVERAAELFNSWLKLTFEGNYDEEHARKVFRIGLAHTRAGVPERLMVLQMGAFAREILSVALEEEVEPSRLIPIMKALFWNLAIMIHSYDAAKKESLRRTTNISEALFERLVRISADEIYREFVNEK